MAVLKLRTKAPVLRGTAFSMSVRAVPRRVCIKLWRVKRANMATGKATAGAPSAAAKKPKAKSRA